MIEVIGVGTFVIELDANQRLQAFAMPPSSITSSLRAATYLLAAPTFESAQRDANALRHDVKYV
jgi:hypothetical protein